MLKTNQIRSLTLSITSCLALLSAPLLADNISKKQMTADITYLASDDLKGRASFSPEIDIAANYIGKRFSDIGLKTFEGLSTYKQTFAITSITPSTFAVNLNGKKIPKSNITVASTMKSLSWTTPKAMKTHILGKKDNFRDLLRKVNNAGGQNLILVNTAHNDIFQKYQQFLNRGLTKLVVKGNEKDHQGAIVLVLTNETNVEQIQVQASTTISKKSLTNVVGILPGNSKADEIVMFSAHYDHLGTTPDGKQIYNGADDDASGTAAVINLAEHFAKQNNNARTLMFAAFTAEEIGGYGSRYLSQQLNPDNVVAMINIEMIGKPSKFGAGTVWMTGMERSNLGELLNKSLAPHNMEIFTDPYPEQGLFYRSDNATLARLGVPAHSFSSTQLDKDQHYHQTSDDINSLDLNSMHKVIESLSIASKDIVNGKITPTRVDVSKVDAHGKIY
ncbi:M20/M25/M40 family metallo-hydrolase [Colwellia sp. UCD-KL20]|uniref:M20/M25/M40 family metallo-hydrolase n=1 Tax=Colwellia sp. UCD-KL20 TaxID=1917165 RepID=UPI0009709E84|nr:M20/M25/M40 family metallo-hydrolase [Colwellia sp. UCD-KL20]